MNANSISSDRGAKQNSELQGVTGEELAEIAGGYQSVFADWKNVPHRVIYGCGTMILVDSIIPFCK